MPQRKFAVFDIDGTLIRWQLYHAVVDQLAKKGLLGKDAHQALHEARMSWKRRENPDAFHQYEADLIKIYERAFDHLSTQEFDQAVKEVIEEYGDQAYVYTKQLLTDLKKQGYVVLAISGSHHEVVAQIAAHYQFDDWIGTTYERQADKFSGHKIVASHAKDKLLYAFIAKHDLTLTGSLAVGDSSSDIAMLAMVEQPIAFNPEVNLYQHAKQAGWKIVVERKNVIYELEANDGHYQLA